MPQLHHAERWILAAHIPDQFQFRLSVLIVMAVGTSGPVGQGPHTAIPAALPEVDIRPAFVVLSTCSAHAVFRRVFHQGLPVPHVLCYTGHEGYGPLSVSW